MVLMKRWSIIRCRMSTLILPTIYNVQQYIYKSILVFDIYILNLDWLIEASRRPVQNSYVCKLWYTERKKLSHFDIKSWVTWRTKIQPCKLGSCRIFESNWLKLRVKLTQHWESNWLNIESLIDSTLRIKLTQHWESNWLNIESLIGSTWRVKLAQHWESSWLNIESKIDSNILQLLTLPGRIIIPPVTQLLRSKWINFSLGALRENIESFWPKIWI